MVNTLPLQVHIQRIRAFKLQNRIRVLIMLQIKAKNTSLTFMKKRNTTIFNAIESELSCQNFYLSHDFMNSQIINFLRYQVQIPFHRLTFFPLKFLCQRLNFSSTFYFWLYFELFRVINFFEWKRIILWWNLYKLILIWTMNLQGVSDYQLMAYIDQIFMKYDRDRSGGLDVA